MATKKINTDLQIEAGLLDGDGNSGTANQILISTGTGVDWVDGSGSSIIGGPYLPLSAGSSYPLTGTLYGTNTNWSGNGDYAGSLTLGIGASTQEAHLQIGPGRTGNGYSYIDLIGDATYTDYGLRIIRNNLGPNTTSAIIHRGTGNFEISTTDSSSILLKTNNVERMRITNAGNVGIGTTSPGYKLEVDGTFSSNAIWTTSFNVTEWGSGTTAYGTLTWGTGYAKVFANSGNQLQLAAGGASTDMTIDTSGNVGIGTTSPQEKFVVNAGAITAIASDGAYTAGYFAKLSSDYGPNALKLTSKTGDIIRASDYGSSVSILTGNPTSVKMFINSAGNVGIGTTSPGSELDVSSSSTSIIRLSNSDTALTEGQKTGSLEFYQSDTSGNGTGVTGRISMSSAKNGSNENYYGNAADMIFQVAAPAGFASDNATLNALTIKNSSGNVGIGTTSPLTKLEVYDGDIKLNDSTRNLLIGEEGSSSYQIKSSGYLIIDATSGIQINKTTSGNVTIGSGNVGIGTTSPNNFGFLEKVLNISAGSSSSTTLQQAGIVISGSSDADDADDFGYLSFTNYQSAITNDRVAEIRALKNGTNVDTGEFAFYTSSGSGPAERMRIDSSGNVGIGTTSPTQKLQVEGNIYTGGSIRIEDNGDQLEFGNANVALQRTANFLELGGYDGIIFRSSNTTLDNQSERMRITSSGNVGIGTTSPAYKLDVSGDIRSTNRVRANTDVIAGGFIDVTGDIAHRSSLKVLNKLATNWLTWATRDTSGSDSVINLSNIKNIIASGNVGIGATSPKDKLDLYDADDNVGIYFHTATSGVGGADGLRVGLNNTHAFVWNYENTPLSFGTNGSQKATILANGNVGIGTTSPSSKLTINGDARLSNNGKLYLWNDHSINYLDYRTWVASSAAGMTIENSAAGGDILLLPNGNVGIGTTSPAYKLDVAGNIRVDSTSVAQIFLDSAASNDAVLNFHENASQKGKIGYDTSLGGFGFVAGSGAFSTAGMVLLDGGNVGIGTTSPVFKLDVSGNGIRNIRTTAGWAGWFENTGSSSGVIVTAGVDSGDAPLLIRKQDGTELFSVRGNGVSWFNGGSVGIGTTNPLYKLDVASGSSSSAFGLSLSGTARLKMYADSTYNYYAAQSGQSHRFTTSGGAEFLITNGGNVGIGTTSPAVQLELGDNTADEKLRLTGAASGKPLMTFYNTTTKIGQISSSSVGVTVTSLGSGNMSFENGGAVRLAIENGGDVGIGDTTPSYKLDVDGTIRATGDVIAYSDVRVKENIKTIDNALEKVNKLRGVEFNKIGSEEKSIGVIAQEIEKVLPEVVKEDDKGMKSVAYGNIVGVLIEAIKDQQKQIDELKSIINGGTK